MSEIHVNDIGTAIRVTIKDESDAIVDISTATEKKMYFKKPDKSVIVKNASLTTDGTDGKMHYTFASGEIDLDGKWRAQGKVVFADGQWYSSITDFQVEPNLED